MKLFLKYFALILIFLGTGKVASATALNGTISFGGSGMVTPTGLTFDPASQIVAVKGTGSLSSFHLGQDVAFVSNFTFAAITPVGGGETMFTTTNSAGTQTLQFKVTSYTVTAGGKYTFLGTLSLYAGATATGTATSSSTATMIYTNSGTNTFSAALTTAPEPSSLVLLGTGLVSAAGMMMRRRRRGVATA